MMKFKTDDELQKEVIEEIEGRTRLEPTEIGVSVRDGIVSLYGVTDSYRKKKSAERAARQVEGVKAIGESIEVKLPDSCRRKDQAIAQAAHAALLRHTSVPNEQIKVLVRNGWIILEGVVDRNQQKLAAEQAVEILTGVYGVVNSIQIKS